ncbi:MAG TPA: helix-turn-helix domain-containing protein [Puia sp.]|nr:helix-turn-helix domain-containing protein [Puia sp.]
MQSKYYPIEVFFSCLKGKYKIPLLIYLKHAPKRYHQIRKKFPQSSERILIKQLKELVDEQILVKKITGTKAPLKVEYFLSEYGFTLCSVVQNMWNWGETHYKTRLSRR